MSRTLTVRDVAELALQSIGAMSINDSAAQPDDLTRAMRWLDPVLAHFTGMSPAIWLLQTLSATLPTGTSSTTLPTLFGASYPADGVEFWSDASVRATTSDPTIPPTDTPLDFLTRSEWEAITSKQQTGRPEQLYIDRNATAPTAYWWPQVDPNAGISYQLRLTVQVASPDVTANPTRRTNLRTAYNLWVPTELAARIGAGPVRMMQEEERKFLRAEADKLWMQLSGFAAQEAARPRQTVYTDF